MLELDLRITAQEALEECLGRGLVVQSERELAGRRGSRHRHLRFPGRAGTLELNEWGERVWVKVHPLRDGGWATALAHELANGRTATVVERRDTEVMFTRAADEQEAITRAWAELEGLVGSLRGRRFYGVLDPGRREYRACVELRDGDDPDALALETTTLPGGRYARVTVEGEPPAVYASIAPAFARLARRPDRDPTRPEIEFYRRRDAIDLLVPVA